jgi:predicted MFS family arabinose efflux permease
VFSFHTFAGMLGNAAAPATLVYLQSVVGWRGAMLCAAALGVISAIVLMLQGEPVEPAHATARARKAAAAADPAQQGWRLLMSTPILLNLFFFILLSIAGGGLNNYLIVALGALHGTSFEVANTALTTILIMSAAGVLVGGILTGRTSRHGLVAASGLVVTAISSTLIGLIDFPALALVLLLATAGFFSGITMPSRDMIVRAATPAGAYGRVFGFVSTGFNIGGIVSPLIFGQLLDHGRPADIFFTVAGCTLISIATVVISTTRKRAKS